jgi:hypothetical protein
LLLTKERRMPFCEPMPAHRPKKPLGEVAQALLLLSLKSKAEGPTHAKSSMRNSALAHGGRWLC